MTYDKKRSDVNDCRIRPKIPKSGTSTQNTP